MMRHASPIALLEVAQAVTMHMFGPRKPNSIEMSPLAMLLMSIGMVKAETRSGPLVDQRAVLVFERFQSADAAAHEHAEAVAIHLLEVDAGIAHRAFRRGHRKVGEAIGPLVFLGIVEDRFRIEVAHLARDPAVVAGRIEARDLDDAAAAFEQVLPEGFEFVAQRRDDTHSGDDDSAVHWWSDR